MHDASASLLSYMPPKRCPYCGLLVDPDMQTAHMAEHRWLRNKAGRHESITAHRESLPDRVEGS